MVLGRLLAATDESSDGRHAVRVARRLSQAPASATILNVLPVPASGEIPAGRLLSTRDHPDGAPGTDLCRFLEWLGDDGGRDASGSRPEVAVAFGIPGIEINRMAEQREVDLVVLGRRPRAPTRRLLLGATADAVVRRCDTAVLFVPPEVSEFRHLLVALDGAERCVHVLETAHRFAVALGARLSAVHIQFEEAEDRGGAPMPRPRRVRLEHLVGQLGKVNGTPVALERGRGDPIDGVLAAADRIEPDALIIGYRRGGLPKVFGPSDVARSLLYAAPSAVLTVPL
ncbi:MAG: universal stress protein [Gemmatimonadales bacterium]